MPLGKIEPLSTTDLDHSIAPLVAGITVRHDDKVARVAHTSRMVLNGRTLSSRSVTTMPSTLTQACASNGRSLTPIDNWASSRRLLSRTSGIPDHRLDQLYKGAPVSRTELAALAAAWKVEIDQVMLTLPAGALAE